LHALEGLMSRYKPETDALRQHLREVGDYPEGELEGLIMAATPHMVAAYKEGRMKATASIGRRLVQKNLELSRRLREVRQALESVSEDALARNEALQILGEDEGPTTAEQEIRAKALEYAADAADTVGATLVGTARNSEAEGAYMVMSTLRLLAKERA
jgi:hypothetical protein